MSIIYYYFNLDLAIATGVVAMVRSIPIAVMP